MYTKNTPQIALAGAQLIVSTGLAEAAARGLEISIAVVDTGGHPVMLARTDGAELQTVQVAERKARSAAFTATSTGRVSKAGNHGTDHHLLAITLAAGADAMVTVSGGQPIVINERCVGGVGVSGAAHFDSELALAAIAAIAPSTV
jgi:glc operon protein GlcG